MSKAYKEAGVDVEAGNRAVGSMKGAVEATFNSQVLSRLGDFGGLFDLTQVCRLNKPVLVASTDGVGTKVEVARVMKRWDTVGQCLVNHCVNDILVQGAKPLFFLDFIGCHELVEEVVAKVVQGMAKACSSWDVALLGGETAEMGAVYGLDGLEVAGTIVGVVERDSIIDGHGIKEGDVVLGLPSTGLHTNGYTLARQLLAGVDWTKHELEGETIGEHLLKIHRCYLPEAKRLWEAGLTVKGMAHVTGGGIRGNFRRVLPSRLGAELSLAGAPKLPVFQMLRELGGLSFDDMEGAFNMGVGMMFVLSPDEAAQAQELNAEFFSLGRVNGDGEIRVRP